MELGLTCALRVAVGACGMALFAATTGSTAGTRPPSHANGATAPGFYAPLIATMPVGLAPTALAVDTRRGRIFVLNAGSPQDTPTHSLSTGRQPTPSVSILDATTGHVLHTTPVDPSPAALAVDQRTGRVFVACDGVPGAEESSTAVDVLDAATGTLVATLPLGYASFGPQALAVDEPAGRVYLSMDQGVEVLDATTGRVIGRVPGAGGGAIVVDPRRHRAFVIGGDSITMLDSATLSVMRSQNIPPAPPGATNVVALDARSSQVFYLFGGIHVGYLGALNTRTGNVLYNAEVNGNYFPLVLGVDQQRGHVFVDTNFDVYASPALAMYDGQTGKPLHVTALPRQDAFPYQPGHYQYVTVDSAANRTFIVTSPPSAVPVQIGGASRPGALVVLDATTGRLLSQHRIGCNPQAVAIDALRHRVFVANQGDNTVSVFDATKL